MQGQVADQPKPEHKRCGAKNRPGAKHATCQDRPVIGRERCRRHGGLTPRGEASPHFRSGEHGRHGPPVDLSELYQASVGDPELMRFRHDAALLETLRRALTMGLAPNRAVTQPKAKQILDLTEGLRRIKDSEAKRLAVLQQMVPLEQFRRAMRGAAAVTYEVMAERMAAVKAAIDAGDLVKAAALLSPEAWGQEMARRFAIAALRIPAVIETTVEGGDE